MRTLLTVAFICAGSAAGAQELSWYAAEGRTFYEASNCTPGSKAAFYSSAHGGRLLRSQTVGADGTALFSGPDSLRPQMLLNAGATGTHRVAYLKPRELTFAAPALEKRGGQNILTWEAAAAPDAGVSFDVLRSVAGKPFQSVAVVPAKPGAVSLPYTYTETAPEGAALYKIRVRSKARGQRHLTEPMQGGGSPINVYPTAVTRDCYISSAGAGSYAILSQDGRKLAAGPLTGPKTAVSMAALPAGSYIVRVGSGGEERQVKVLRQ